MPNEFAHGERFGKGLIRCKRDDEFALSVDHRDMQPTLDDQSFLRVWREFRGMSQQRLADGANTSKGHVSDLERGKKELMPDMARRLADALNITVDELRTVNPLTGERSGPKVPLYGFVHASDHAEFYGSQDVLEYIDAPRGATKDTKALQVKGDSLGRWYVGWVVFFDDQRTPPTEDLYNQLCVVGLQDGSILLKVLRWANGRFHLESQNPSVETLFDVKVDWAAAVKGMSRR